MNIEGVLYYDKLIDDGITRRRTLYGDYKNRPDLLQSGIIACRNFAVVSRYSGRDCNPDTGKNIRRFALFKSHADLFNHMMNIPVHQRSMFEVIPGDRPHKPHFDIDIDMTNNVNVNEIMSDVIDAICDTMKNNGIVLDTNNDILIYTSSGSEKASYHIIINNWKHNNNKDAKNLAKQVRSNFPEHIADYIDKSVYSSKQQFRLLHCSKLRTQRVKIPVPEWKTSKYHIKYPVIQNMYDEFLASLVSVTIGCKFLPLFYDPSLAIVTTTDGRIIQHDDTHEVTEENRVNLKKVDIDKCMISLYSKMEDILGCAKNRSDIWNTFNVRSREGGMISLTKRRSYFCPICTRKHENENPYITVNNNGSVRYHCRRAETSLYLTSIVGQQPEEEIEEVESNITPQMLMSVKFPKLHESKIEEQKKVKIGDFYFYENYNRFA